MYVDSLLTKCRFKDFMDFDNCSINVEKRPGEPDRTRITLKSHFEKVHDIDMMEPTNDPAVLAEYYRINAQDTIDRMCAVMLDIMIDSRMTTVDLALEVKIIPSRLGSMYVCYEPGN